MTTVEDLTKTQIVLLTLLVSFITSIATGIITTSLLAQAPQGVTQTIDRVVEQTVEQVAPASPTTGSTTVKETTVVSEDDAVQSSIASALPSIVRISSPSGSGSADFYALGVIVSSQGLVLSDQRGVVASGTYNVALADGSTLPATVVAASNTGSLVLFKITPDQAHATGFPALSVAKGDLNLGQTVIAIEGKDKNAVDVGRVLSLDDDAGRVETDITPANEIQGGALLDLSGDLVGLKTSNTDMTLPASAYTNASSLTTFINAHASSI